MKLLFFALIFLNCSVASWGQLPRKVTKLEGSWAYKAGSGYERWELSGNTLDGTSFRINKLGDTIIAERMQISSVNNRLVMHLEAYHTVGDSLRITERNLIGKKRKMEFTGVSSTDLESLTYKPAFFSRKKFYIYIHRKGSDSAQKLVLIREEAD